MNEIEIKATQKIKQNIKKSNFNFLLIIYINLNQIKQLLLYL